MSTQAFITTLLFVFLSTVSAESLDVYIGTYTQGLDGSKGIYRSNLDLETGRLAGPVLIVKADNPSFLAIHPNGKFIYAVSESRKENNVNAYAIEKNTDKLKLLNTQSSGGAAPCHLSIDNLGKNLYVANYSGGSVSVFPIQPGGKLDEPTSFVQHKEALANPEKPKKPRAHSINTSFDNRFAFAADLGLDKIMIYQLDVEKGSLVCNDRPFAKVKDGAGPRHFTFHPNGKYAYAINELDSTITGFAYDPASGELTEITAVSTIPKDFNGTNWCADIHVHPNGKFLYGSNRGHDSIAVYQIDPATGKLTFVEHETTDIKTPRNFNIDPTGKLCVVANQKGNSLVVFRINQNTGKLIPTGNKISVPMPICIQFLRSDNTSALPQE